MILGGAGRRVRTGSGGVRISARGVRRRRGPAGNDSDVVIHNGPLIECTYL